MRNVLLLLAGVLFLYGCSEISGKEGPSQPGNKAEPTVHTVPSDINELRVGKNDAAQMRRRRGKDDSSFKISAKDLQALMATAPAANDSFVFYLVQYDGNSQKDRDRYLKKVPTANWADVAKKPSSVLVGFVSGGHTAMHLSRKRDLPIIPVYDLAVVCPPPPNCGCDIAQ